MPKKKPAHTRGVTAAKKSSVRGSATPPNVADLARYSPGDPSASHPSWVKERFPDYVGAHVGHEAKSVREFTHQGHVVKITTTYTIEVDGQLIAPRLSVDEDGRVYTHATPFVNYGSAVDLMKAVIDKYPKNFAHGSGHGGPDGGHGAHGGGHHH